MRIPHKLINEYGTQVGPYGLAIYLALCRFADSEDMEWPSHQVIANKLGISCNEVIRAIQKLVAVGLVAEIPQYDEETGEQQCTLYVLLDISDNDAGERETVLDNPQLPPRSNSLILRTTH